MITPHIGILHPTIHQMEIQIQSWLAPISNPPEMMLTMTTPLMVRHVTRLLIEAYIDSLPEVPTQVSDRIPLFNMNNFPISFMVWNAQGVGSQAFLSVLREIIRAHKPVVFALVETHMGGDYADSIASKLNYSGHTRVDAEGFAGGIWVFWKSELVSVGPVQRSNQHLTFEITKVGDTPWYFSVIYANPDPAKKHQLWQTLKNFAESHNKPWLLSGDFNDTRFSWERNSYSVETSRRARKFNEWIVDMELVELEFSGPSHTWSRGLSKDTRKSARLDRSLCNTQWSAQFSKAAVKHLPALQSDHCPLLIAPNGFAPLAMINKPFRFQAAWLTHEKFEEFLKSKWSNDTPLVALLETLAHDLTAWNKDVFHNIFQNKRQLMARIDGIQRKLAIKYDGGLIKLERKLRANLDEVLYQEELFWYQKARVDWIRDGDRNTSFFHLSTIIKQWKNKIVALKDDNGDWISHPEHVKNFVVNYFKNLYTEDNEETNCEGPKNLFPQFQEYEWNKLTRTFTCSEIHDVVKCMGSLKAPGPDGFQALFYQKNWNLVASSVFKLVLDVLAGKGIPPSLNNTFIALIPKVNVPESPKQFRPIGLCNVTYKIITKVIVNRLKVVLPKLISPTQASYVPGRQITDNIVIFQEVLHSMRSK